MMGQITEEVAMQAETTNIPELSTRENFKKITLPQGTKRKGSNGNTNQECTGFSCLSGCRRNAGFSGRDEGIDGLLVEECQISG